MSEIKGLSFNSDTLSTNGHKGIICANSACTSTKQVAIDSRMKPYLNLYPLPNAGEFGDSGRFASEAVRRGDEQYFIGKIDHYFSSATTLNGHYSFDDTPLTYPTIYAQKTGSAPSRRHNAIVSLQHVFSPTLINNTRGGVTRTRAGNEIDCCATIPGIGDTTLSFVPGQPVGQFNVTGLRNTFAGLGAGGMNDFH